MGCSCNNRANPELALRLQVENSLYDPVEWGPIVWRYLHSLTERLGVSGQDNNEAQYIQTMLRMLPQIIPCRECQQHAREYIKLHPVPLLINLRGETLRRTVREWLFTFHTAVRTRKGQPVIISTIEECMALYTNSTISSAEYTKFIQGVAYASRKGWVKLENWRKWYNYSERLRQMLGNVIV